MQLPDIKMYRQNGKDLGYDSKELAKWMKKRHFLKSWEKWSLGSTGSIIGKHFIVYFWDVEQFLAGERNWDFLDGGALPPLSSMPL